MNLDSKVDTVVKYLLCSIVTEGLQVKMQLLQMFAVTAQHYFDDKKIKKSSNCNDLTKIYVLILKSTKL